MAVVVDLVVDGVAVAVVDEVVAAAVVGVLESVAVGAAAATVTVEVAWRAMPRPRALAIPTLREATRARLRLAGCGRFVLMSKNLWIGCEGLVSPG